MLLLKPNILLLDHNIQWPEVPQQPPRDHRHLLGRRADFWRRSAKVLWLVASGFSLGTEIQRLIAQSEGVNYRSGALYRLLPRLIESRILRAEVCQVYYNYRRVRLRLVSLEPNSQALMQRLKWQPVETEWERMVRLHEKGKQDESRHTLAVIAFAYHARLRGYQAGVMPVVERDRFVPDAVVMEQDGERVFVEVERTGTQKTNKWEQMADYQGFVAFCGRTKKHRERLIHENNWDLGIPGRATDLQTLFSESWNGEIGPLWAECW